jgi:hypothetical protein
LFALSDSVSDRPLGLLHRIRRLLLIVNLATSQFRPISLRGSVFFPWG